MLSRPGHPGDNSSVGRRNPRGFGGSFDARALPETRCDRTRKARRINEIDKPPRAPLQDYAGSFRKASK